MPDVREGKLADLTPDVANANKGTPRGRYMLDHSLRQYGAGRSILVDKHGRIIAGNKTAEAAADIGLDKVIVVRTVGDRLVVVQRDDLDLDDGDRARQLAYADNRAGEIGLAWDHEQLKIDLDAGLDLGPLFFDLELDAILAGPIGEGLGNQAAPARASLAERFVVPPFSVLDARKGYWQDRKAAWLALGLQPQEATQAGDGSNPAYQNEPLYHQAKYSGRSPDGLATGTGASVFDPVLCEVVYRWFNVPGGHVLDPFAGESSKGAVAAYLGYGYTGVELRAEQVAANIAQWRYVKGRALDNSSPVQVSVSAKWLQHEFACSPDYIENTCKGGCCEASHGTLICLLPDEVARFAALGYDVKDGVLQASQDTGKCPMKQPSGFCAVHGQGKPFGCVASPFTLNDHDTLIVRHRYSRMACHGKGQPAYVVFRPSLDLIFGHAEAQRVCDAVVAGQEEIKATMPRAAYDALHYLDRLKHGAASPMGGPMGGPGGGPAAGLIDPIWITGDSVDLDSLLPDGQMYDLIFTSPPYYDLEIYSQNDKDGSAFETYDKFMAWYAAIFKQAIGRLRDNRFLVVKVGEIRDKRGGQYRGFVPDNCRVFTDLGLQFYNEAILVTMVGSLPIRVASQFTGNRKLGKAHQNILVFYKGDIDKIKDVYPSDVQYADLSEQEAY